MQKTAKFSQWVTRNKLTPVLLALIVFFSIFIIYQQYAVLLGRKTTSLTYWDLLAKAFLDGRLYLTNPPTTWDLTFFQGHWYVPEPPLPALLMVPLVWLFGSVNPVIFSIFFSAINGLLLLLILSNLSELGWITTSKSGMVWLVSLFAFGTPHWWVGMDGRVWQVSQILTVTFIALAVLLALKSKPPLLVGLCLGLAILSRPNVAVIWPLLFALFLQIQIDKQERWSPRRVIIWVVLSLIPVILAGAGLLFYNYLRFHSFMDFGYADIQGDSNLVAAIASFGMFSIHYMPRNLSIMFLKLPDLVSHPPYISPSITGMSMLVTTPAFIFLFRRYEKRAWIIGAGLSVFLSLLLLSMYHNTGTAQFGYRYILDLIIPLMMLMAVNIKGRIPWYLVVIILMSIIINEFGAFWFIRYLNG